MFIDLLRDTAILFYFLAPLFSYFLIVAGLVIQLLLISDIRTFVFLLVFVNKTCKKTNKTNWQP